MTDYPVIAFIQGGSDTPVLVFYPKAAIAAKVAISYTAGIEGRLECSPQPYAEETAEIRVVIESPEAIAKATAWLHENPLVDLEDDRFYRIKVDG